MKLKKLQVLNKVKQSITKLTFLKVSRFLFCAFVFLIPFQIDVVVYTSPVYEGGNFNPYTSVFYYLADIVFLLSLISWGIAIFSGEFKQKLTYGRWFIFLLLILFVLACQISVIFAEDSWLSLMLSIRFLELIIVYLYMVNHVVKLDTIINVFIASVSFQAAIAMMQYINQGSIGLHFFGEPMIAPETPGIAKMNIDGVNIVRSYGTFQHSNILAGYLLTGIFLTFYRIRQKEHLAYPIMILLLAALVLTFSRSAMLALVVSSLVFISIKDMKMSFKYVFLALSLFVFFVVIFNLEGTIFNRLLFTDSGSFDERVFYFSIAKKMMYLQPFGVGLGNFTLAMPDFTAFKLAPWDFQPVHNIYMLLINETGFVGFGIFATLLVLMSVYLFAHQNKFKSEKPDAGVFILAALVALAVVGLFDHYLVSLYQGQLLLFLVLGLSGGYLMTKIR
jgi:hypothetical protein